MGLIELLVVILLVAWVLGYFGRGRFYSRGTGSIGGDSNLIHTLLVIIAILVVLRLLRLI